MADPAERNAALLKEHEHWAESYWRNEALGESRVTFFTGLVAAVGTAITALSKHDTGIEWERVEALTRLAAPWLCAIGATICLRIFRRNKMSSLYLETLKTVRRRLLPGADADAIMRQMPKAPERSFWNGGLGSQLVLVEGALCGVATWAWAIVVIEDRREAFAVAASVAVAAGVLLFSVVRPRIERTVVAMGPERDVTKS